MASTCVAAHSLLAELRRKDPAMQFATTQAGLTRGGVLSAELLASLLLVLVADAGRHGYQTLLDDFWEEARAAGIAIPGDGAPTAPSFCNARKRLRPEVLLALLGIVVERLLREHPARRRYFAVDGSRLNVQRSDELWRTCGGNNGSGSPQVQISVLFELTLEVPLHVDVGPFDSSEREQCLAHIPHLRAGDVLVLDRGYPGFGLLHEIQRRRIDLVARVATSSTFPAVERFVASGCLDADIEIAPTASFRRTHPAQPLRPLRLRAVRLAAPDGTPIVILTSLPRAAFSRRKIAELYRRRWRIEEHFRLLKSDFFGSAQFHAKSFAGVKQEIFAQALHLAITRLLASAATSADHTCTALAAAHLHLKDALHVVSRYLVELLLSRDDVRVEAILQRFRQRMRRRARPPRPGRSHPRRSFRPCPKWCSTGRRGRSKR